MKASFICGTILFKVKFESNKASEESTTCSHNATADCQKVKDKHTKQCYTGSSESINHDELATLLKIQENSKNSTVEESNISMKKSPSAILRKDQDGGMSTKPLLEKKNSLVKYCVSDEDVHVETVENNPEEEYNDEDASSESYPASSHYTENTDSVTGGFGLTNRVSVL